MATAADHIQNAEHALTGHGYNNPTPHALQKADVHTRIAQAKAWASIADSLATIAAHLTSDQPEPGVTARSAIHHSV